MSFSLFEYTYNAQTSAPPAAGQLRFNNADPLLATSVFLSGSTAPGVDVSNMLPFAAGTELVVQDKDDASRVARFATGPAIQQPGYLQLPVTFTNGSGTLPAGQRVLAVIGTRSDALPAGADPGEFLGVNTEGDPEWMVVGAGPAPAPPPSSAECWPVDHSCCPDFPADLAAETPEVQALWKRADALAASTLRMMTGYRVGGCPVVVRPCKRSCWGQTYASFPVTSRAATSAPVAAWAPVLSSGRWLNMACGCGAVDGCSCTKVCEVLLDAEWAVVSQVKVDGIVLDPTAYRLDPPNRLTRIDGDCWPVCQDMNADDDQPGTFSVTYTPGIAVDGLGAYAAGRLACEFAKACSGGDCVLPSSVTQVVRSGVTYTLAADVFGQGLTGIREVDAFILRWNPNRLRQPSVVWSPDLPHPRVMG